MGLEPAGSFAPPPPAPPSPALSAAAMLACIFAAALLMLLEFQRRQGAQHYQGELCLVALAAMVGSSLTAVGLAGANLARRRAVARSLLGAVVALAPLGFWALVGAYGQRCWSVRHVPNNSLMNLVKGLGASLMEAQAAWLYPDRVERGRFVMFHRGLPNAESEAGRMTGYLDDLEDLIGEPPRQRIHWVRGRLLGQGGLSLYGLALGSAEAPNLSAPPMPLYGLGTIDRHEVAHAYLTGLLPPDADVPTVLSEGWAEAAARGWIQLGGGGGPDEDRRGLFDDQADPALPRLPELLGPAWYHEDHGAVYRFGPYLVRYLVVRDGFPKFRELCARIRPETVDAVFQEIYGATPAMIEQELIRDSLAPLENPPEGELSSP